MKTIHKQNLKITDRQEITVPAGSKFLSLQMQHGHATIWYATGEDHENTNKWKIRCFGTGHPMPDAPLEFLGTVQLDGGALVFHFFREAETA